MPTARRLLVDHTSSNVFHCISRCVRRAFLLGNGYEHRRAMLRRRMADLSEVFAVDVLVFAVMSNHIHLVVRTLPEVVARWSDREVARRWRLLCPDRKLREKLGIATGAPPCNQEIDALAADARRIRVLRARLSSLSEYHKYLKQWIARRANLEDECTGHFFEGRFRSIVLLDDLAQLMGSLYVLLNPVRAGLSSEGSADTSLPDMLRSAHRAALRRRGATKRETGTLLEALVSGLDDGPVEPALPARRGGQIAGPSPSLVSDDVSAWMRPSAVRPVPVREALAMRLGEFLRRLRAAESHLRVAFESLGQAEGRRCDGVFEAESFKTWLTRLVTRPSLPAGTVAGCASSLAMEASRRGGRRVVDALGLSRLAVSWQAAGPT